MQMFLLGLLNSSAAYGCAYCHYSRWPRYNNITSSRTIESLTEAAVEARKKIDAGRKLKPGDFGSSSGHPPMQIISDAPSIPHVLVLPQLHLRLGIIPLLFNQIRHVDKHLALQWLRITNISTNRAHADDDLNGRECTKLMQSVATMQQLIPQRHRQIFSIDEAKRKDDDSAFAPPQPPPAPHLP